jgi:predicted dehydrogenase
MLRVGFVGAGWISAVHARALERVAEGRAVAVCARTRAGAERFAARYGLELATDALDALLERVDVVCVNSPNARHAEHAMRAAEAGRHVIVEKPLALSAAEGRAIAAACARAGVGLGYAEELCFAPKLVRAREIAASGALGELRYVTQREAHAGPHSPWFFSPADAGGGVLMDMACHSIECVRWLLGKPACRRVFAQLSAGRPDTPLEDHAVVQLELGGGTIALCEASWALQGGMQSRLELWGRRATLVADLLQDTGLRQSLEGGAAWRAESGDWLWENGYPQELAHFLRCFRDGRRPDESGDDGVAVLEILEAAYASARQGRALALPAALPAVARAVDHWLGGKP